MSKICRSCAAGLHPHDTYTETSPEVSTWGEHEAGEDAGCPNAQCECEHVNPPKHRGHCQTCTCYPRLL